MNNEIIMEKPNKAEVSNIPKTFNSKWANLKILLQNKTSLETSVKLLKKQTINQFSSKCCEIYKDKIGIYLLNHKNKKILSSSLKKNNKRPYHQKIAIKGDVEELCSDTFLKDFFFYFRGNNEEMLKLINLLNQEQRQMIIPFLCHFFYENFFMESIEQEEIFYLIYLLLEKEVDNMCAPLSESFLTDSFLGDFLLEMANKYEIKNYIDIVLNSLIREINEIHSIYYSLDIIRESKNHYKNFIKYKTHNSFYNMNKQNFYENEIFFSQTNSSKHADKKALSISVNKKITEKNRISINQWDEIDNDLIYETSYINDFLNKNFFNILNENYINNLFYNEKEPFMKLFYLKQLKQINSLKNQNLYNCKDYYYEKMVKAGNISKKSIEQYNAGYALIIKFIYDLLTKLEIIVIIPYSIKVICRLIYLLVQKKFKNISEMQKTILVCNFIFDKLIIPILENPDCSNISKNMIITVNTRKNLFNISLVLKKLIRGELFCEEKFQNYNIFNKFIIENFLRLKKIVQNFINVKLPDKILFLLDKFYNDENFSLAEREIESSEINYDYFKENPSEFMQHDSICFNIEQFFLLYDVVNNNKDTFIVEGSKFDKIFNNLSKYIHNFEKSNKNYYVIIKENYSKEEEKLLFHEEKMLGLSKSKTPEDLLFKLKFCITFLLSKIEISNQWDWVLENYDTKNTFNFINKYLIMQEKKETSKLVPLNWYSKYILKNLELINESYKIDDYQLLSYEIEDDVYNLIDKLKELNEFLTVNIRTKFAILENRKKSYKEELIEMEKSELNIKTLLFIESAEVGVCFMDGQKYKEIQKKIDSKSILDKKKYVICNKKYCIHKKLLENEYKTLKKKGKLNKYHCHKIKEFADIFSQYYPIIMKEIVNYFYDSYPTALKCDDISRNVIATTESIKDVLNIYMTYVSKIVKEHYLFNNSNYINDWEEEMAKKGKRDKEKEKVLNIIWNYILKSLCIKIYDSSPLEIDALFTLKCVSYSSFVKPQNFKISSEFCDENILDKVKYHLKKMEKKRTPEGMNQEFGKAVHLISSMYKFYLNQIQTEAGDMLPIIIYSIVSIKPKRIVFNVCFSKYFCSESEEKGNFGYNMTQAESAIKYINKLDAKTLGFTEKEYNENVLRIANINI